jgi:hypothetical protein
MRLEYIAWSELIIRQDRRCADVSAEWSNVPVDRGLRHWVTRTKTLDSNISTYL